ncbi:wings apart-like protein 1 [Hibiscus syriacus]|uniref:wings apart-like protein 1 n=1 Tax=Hibiscus syriacus TaxID=106335 RepID=UPI0019236832|nr:wings apart-like protein 1 [Hibiscus syriacus]
MNLTNDKPLGCRQIAASGALEILSTLIACHYPTFCSYLPHSSEMEVISLSVEHHNQKDRPLTDPELDFLVAILGLLVNLVEKDEHKRFTYLLCIQCSGFQIRVGGILRLFYIHKQLCVNLLCRSRLAAASVSLPNSKGLREGSPMAVIPLLCAIFVANQGEDDGTGGIISSVRNLPPSFFRECLILLYFFHGSEHFIGTSEVEEFIIIVNCLPKHSLSALVPVLERFVVCVIQVPNLVINGCPLFPYVMG